MSEMTLTPTETEALERAAKAWADHKIACQRMNDARPTSIIGSTSAERALYHERCAAHDEASREHRRTATKLAQHAAEIFDLITRQTALLAEAAEVVGPFASVMPGTAGAIVGACARIANQSDCREESQQTVDIAKTLADAFPRAAAFSAKLTADQPKEAK